MLSKGEIKTYFTNPEASQWDFERLVELFGKGGFSEDVEPALQEAFKGYMVSEPGSATVKFSVECYALLDIVKQSDSSTEP
jgi:hypothetical protein